MRGGVVSFGQGTGVRHRRLRRGAGAQRASGITDASAWRCSAASPRRSLAAPFAPLLSRYRGIFFAMLTLALSMVAVRPAGQDRRARRLRRLQHAAAPTLFGRRSRDARVGYVALRR